MIFHTKPADFNPRFEVVSCFFEYAGTFLMLHRQAWKPQGNTWGLPAGKVDSGETKEEAIAREMEEEIGYRCDPKEFIFRHTVYVKYDAYDFVYHIYSLTIDERPDLVINEEEHKSHRWVTPREALEMDLIEDEAPCIHLFYNLESVAQ